MININHLVEEKSTKFNKKHQGFLPISSKFEKEKLCYFVNNFFFILFARFEES